MKYLCRLLVASILVLSLAVARAQTAAHAGYKVIIEITFDEQGAAEEGKVVESDDQTGARVLEQIALNLAAEVKQPPRLDKEGKPMKFKARAPFNFPVEGDEGAAANDAPKPSLRSAPLPVYPESLAAAGTVGGAILELIIGADGNVSKATVLRSSHPEFANAAHSAVRTWKFAPAQKDGVAVESRWRIAVNFSVNEKEADWMWRVAPRPSLGSFTAVRAKVPPPEPAAATPAVPAEKK
ncbi:MAG TPA: energy transducer TonB [Lacunisphaera sp.]|nr:energy transducer TonB [Lacunisphaera sp.]